MKNLLVIGLGEKPELLDYGRGYLLITDEVGDHEGEVFDPKRHSFDPLAGIDPRGAVEIAEVIYGTEGKDTLTVRNGKRALWTMLMKSPRLNKLRAARKDADYEAEAAVNDILFLPAVKRVLCRKPNFSFQHRRIVARINRAELGDKAAFILGSMLIRQFKGQIIIPDFGFYARPFHSALIREGRLMAGVNTLSELEPKLRNLCLMMPKVGHGCTFEDAATLAQYECRFPPHTDGYDSFIKAAMRP